MKHAVIHTFAGSAADLSALNLDYYVVTPPTGQQWRTLGLKEGPFDPKLFHIERHERVLPSAVINREAEVRFAAYEDQTGRKPGKKQRAIIKESVIEDLLPKAFIRVSHIAVTIARGLLIVWTSSIPKADEVVSLLVGLLRSEGIDATIEFKPINVPLNVVALGKHDNLMPGSSVVLAGPEKQKVRIKDLSVESHRVQPLIEVDQYSVTEIEVVLSSGDACTITNKGIVKNIQLHDVAERGDDDEAVSWMHTDFVKRLVDATDEDEL